MRRALVGYRSFVGSNSYSNKFITVNLPHCPSGSCGIIQQINTSLWATEFVGNSIKLSRLKG